MQQEVEEDYEPKVTSQALDDRYLQPYEVKTDLEEIKKNCALCQELPCCPDHCCDVSLTLKAYSRKEKILETWLIEMILFSGTLELAKETSICR